MTTKAHVPERIRFTGRTIYRNISFAEGQIVDPAAHGFDALDVENLSKMGNARVLSEGELEELDALEHVRQAYPSQTPLDQVDLVVVRERGEDVLYVDHREKGPADPRIGDREPRITRLPGGDHPVGDLPVGVQRAGHDATPKKLKVEKPLPLPARVDGAGAATGGGLPEVAGTALAVGGTAGAATAADLDETIAPNPDATGPGFAPDEATEGTTGTTKGTTRRKGAGGTNTPEAK